MATQVISFRASGDNLEWLESQRLDGESLSQTAQRICWEHRQMMEEKKVLPFPKPASTPPSTGVNIEKVVQTPNDFRDIAEDIAKDYYAQAISQMNGAIALLREELLGELQA